MRWQINLLYRLQKIKFGERYTIYSPKDGQPCMDHDRSEGEALGPQEYTLIKMPVIEFSPSSKAIFDAAKDKLNGRKVSLVAATLRPETMYGQTNCFVSPLLDYGVFAINDQEAFVCTLRSARNMAFQGNSAEKGKVTQLLEINGKDLIGTKVGAPFCLVNNGEVYVLPMESILPTKVCYILCTTCRMYLTSIL